MHFGHFFGMLWPDNGFDHQMYSCGGFVPLPDKRGILFFTKGDKKPFFAP